jgi:membrane protein implicated in regulation of membrane protease activity
MTWWGWIIGGAILFGAELAFVDAQFYLVFVGSAAILVGLLTVSAGLAPWLQWALFAALAIVSMLTFRSRVYHRLRGNLPTVRTGPAGGLITLGVALAPGETCQAEYGGSYWTVRNDSGAPLAAGTRARIKSVNNLTLHVTADA